MIDEMQLALDRLRSLGTPEELHTLAEKVQHWPPGQRANAHVHLPPNFSAFESVEQAVSLAAEQGIRVLGASNYYDFGVYGDFAMRAHSHGVYPLFGLEIVALLEDLQRASILINDPANSGRMYLCGKGIVRFAPMTAVARELMLWIRQKDAGRMRQMVGQVEQIFAAHGVDTGLNEQRILDRIEDRYHVDRSSVYLQERHVAEAFQEEFFRLVPPSKRRRKLRAILGVPSGVEEADRLRAQHDIRASLMKAGKPAFVAEEFVNFGQAYRLILELGGIPCYPTLADGAQPICAYEDPPEKLVETLGRLHIFCAEFIPIRNKPEVLVRYVQEARKAGIVVTGGTEHNTPNLLPLAPKCREGLPIPAEIEEIFWEGACVVVAHQFLSLHGRCGYVDSAGKPHPDFAKAEDRIGRFRRLGAAVLARYHEQKVDLGVIPGND
jgi:hypothetical protein